MTANLVPAPGVEVPIPTFPAGDNTMFPLVVVLSVKSADVELTVNPPDVTDQVEAAAPVKFKAPAEVKANVPDVTVESVKSPVVTAKDEFESDAIATAPAALFPMVTVPVEFPPLIEELKFDESLILVAPPAVVNAPVFEMAVVVRVFVNLPVPVTSKAYAG